MYTTRQVQEALVKFGYAVEVDGVMGPSTEDAICDFKEERGLAARAYIGPVTESLLFYEDGVYPPWMNEINRQFNLHEDHDNEELTEWLASDGCALGDPSELPWCGDAVDTAIHNTLPDEPRKEPLMDNPYWARNWAVFGEPCELAYGAIVVMTRGSGGHVAFAIGYDEHRERIRIRGGNQRDSICDTWIDESRLLTNSRGKIVGIRRPLTWPKKLPKIPLMDSYGAVVSRNEA